MCGTQPSASDTACDVVVTGRPGLPPIAAATSPAWQGSHLDGIRRPLLRHSPTVGPLGIPLPAVPHYIFANSLHAFEKLPSFQISKLTAPLLSTTLCRSNFCRFCFWRSRALRGTMLARGYNPFSCTTHMFSLANLASDCLKA